MTMTESSGFFTKSMNLPVKPLNAAILPLPKLPTRMELLYSPKSRGVQTTPQGEFIHGPCSRWPISLPAGVKKRTYPSPSPATSSCLAARSEEHTSELQSRVDLVCRLLLEKKKTGICGRTQRQAEEF